MVVVGEKSFMPFEKSLALISSVFFTFSQHYVRCFNIPLPPPLHYGYFSLFWRAVKNLTTSSTFVFKLFPPTPLTFQLVVCKGVCVCSYYGTLS